jgi:hypothetical protein
MSYGASPLKTLPRSVFFTRLTLSGFESLRSDRKTKGHPMMPFHLG